MKIAIVGSRGVVINDFEEYIGDCEEIISGGAKGVDSCIEEYAKNNGIKMTVILPEYNLYGRAAPIVRNKKIVDLADKIIVFWDGQSKGSLSVIKYAEKIGKECKVVICKNGA